MWLDIRAALLCSRHKLAVRWLNSHTGQHVQAHDIGCHPEVLVYAYDGNVMADAYARAGAKKHEAVQQTADQQLEFQAMAEEVLM